jgi:transcriptional regulator with XRE-family HTH domain
VEDADRGRDGDSIGAGIRRERARRGLTLAQLAAQVNLTVSALSQIERGASDPSVSSLRRIAAAFDIPMFRFLVGSNEPDVVVRKARRTRLRFHSQELEYELVSAHTSGEFEILALVLTPGAASVPAAAAHPAEECSVVLRGQVQVELDGEVHLLDAGDSITIHSDIPHRFTNPGATDAEIMMVMSPPTF